MDLEAFVELISRDEFDHVSELALHHFGEPFLQQEFPEFVSAATSLGIRTVASSNMTRMTEALAERTLNAGLTRIIISLDAAEPETYARLRVRGNLKKVESNIKTLLSVKVRLKSPIFVQVQFIVTPENVDEVGAFEERWLAHPGVNQVVIRRERSHAGQVVRHDQYEARDEPRRPCRYLWESLVVLENGDAVPCCKDFDGKEVVGNVFTNSAESVWNGRRMLELRDLHRNEKFSEIALCGDCTEWRGQAPYPYEEAAGLVDQYDKEKSDFRKEPRHMRVWE